jgi:HAD superfamily hydrolase (TIGR01509 family)
MKSNRRQAVFPAACRPPPSIFLSMHSSPPFGALFDWDGVVVDSARQHELSWVQLADEIGLPLPDNFFHRGFGMKNEKIIPEVYGWTRDPGEIQTYSLRKEELYREILKADGIEPLPGVRNFLETLRGAGAPCIVGSSTHRLNIEVCLDLFGFAGYFSGIVSSEDVDKGKPDPAVFLKASEKAGVPPERCIVFEDAPVGIEAGLRGGMKVIGLATTHPREILQAAHRVVERLDMLTLDDLQALWDAPVAEVPAGRNA